MKKLLLFIMMNLLAVSFTQAQILNFQNLDSMNLRRGAITCAHKNNYIYVSNGYSSDSAFTKEIERYNIANDSWSVFTNSLVAKRYASSAIVGNSLYIFNGITSNGINNKMEVVDLTTGVVTYLINNPTPAYSSGVAVWDNDIYVFGGTSSSGYSDSLYKFNTISQTWTQLANMPEGKETKGEIINGKLYVLGGYKGKNSNRIDMYDINTNTWTNLGFMSDSISGHATAVNGNTIYLIGDYTNLNHVASYDINTNVYTVFQNNMIGRRHAGAAVVNSKLYVMGGNQTSAISSSISSLQVTDIGLSVNEIDFNKSISIFPNPSVDKLFINFQQIIDLQNTVISIYNIQGQLIQQQTITNAQTELNISQFAKGVYVVKIHNDRESIVSKFVKE